MPLLDPDTIDDTDIALRAIIQRAGKNGINMVEAFERLIRLAGDDLDARTVVINLGLNPESRLVPGRDFRPGIKLVKASA